MACLELNQGSVAGIHERRIEFDETRIGPSLTAGWTCVGRRVEISSDRLGMIPIFYWVARDRMVVSDSLRELAGRLPHRRFDAKAVASYLRLGYYLGDSTPIEGVKCLLPGAHVVWDGTDMKSSTVYPNVPLFRGGWIDAGREYQHRFANAVRLRTQNGVGHLTLSGGRDSRHILFELLAQGSPPGALLSLDRGNSNDHVIAAEIAKLVGIECRISLLRRCAIDLDLEKNRLNHYLSDENTWYLGLVDHLEGPVFDGLAGDVLSNGLYFQMDVAKLIAAGKMEEGARVFLKHYGGRLPFLAPAFARAWNDELALEAVTDEFCRFQNAPDPVKAFVFWNRTRREIALLPLTMASRAVPVRLPYLDTDLLELLLSLPFKEFGSAGFHDAVIKSAYPEFANIPYASKSKVSPPISSLARYIPRATRLLLNELTVKGRVLGYATESILRLTDKPLDVPLSRLLPLLQAHEEIGIGF